MERELTAGPPRCGNDELELYIDGQEPWIKPCCAMYFWTILRRQLMRWMVEDFGARAWSKDAQGSLSKSR